MPKEILESFQAETLEELATLVEDAIAAAKAAGHDADTVYLPKSKVDLVEETLTDGSKVLNLDLRVAA